MIRCRECRSVVKGTIGIARSLVGAGVLSQGAIRQRLELCRFCPESIPCHHNASQPCRCRVCGCWIKHKARLANESCPAGRW
ncbi:MAG: hypothetical protein Kow00105_14560 [Phycisphaeraceae bacterium]